MQILYYSRSRYLVCMRGPAGSAGVQDQGASGTFPAACLSHRADCQATSAELCNSPGCKDVWKCPLDCCGVFLYVIMVRVFFFISVVEVQWCVTLNGIFSLLGSSTYVSFSVLELCRTTSSQSEEMWIIRPRGAFKHQIWGIVKAPRLTWYSGLHIYICECHVFLKYVVHI